MGEQKVHEQDRYDIKVAVNIQSPISTSYLLCVVYTILAFLTDNKNLECASMCEGARTSICMRDMCVYGCGSHMQQMTCQIPVPIHA